MPKSQRLKDIFTKQLAREYVTGEKSGKPFNGKQAVLSLKPNLTEGSASVEATKKLKETNFKEEVADLIEKGLADKDLLKVHKQGLKATKQQHKIIGRDNQNNPIYDFIDTPDYATRHKYLDTAYKLKDKYPKLNVQANQFNFYDILGELEE